ncbi:MAG: hypothetical protein RBJ76_10585 [Stenomitos frigidus ULC029]
MTDPLFWLVLSLLFVTVSLTIVLLVAIPALRELARASRSAEKLFDTLRREFPPTLQAIRLTGLEISDLTDDVSEGVQSAGQVVKQVDQSLTDVRQQAQRVQSSTRSVVVGIKAAWRVFTRSPKPPTPRRSLDRLPSPRNETDLSQALRESDRTSEALADARISERRAEPLTRVERSRSSHPNPPAIRNTLNQPDRPFAEHQNLDPDDRSNAQPPSS